MVATSGTNPQYAPSASGVPARYSSALAYIGWRTMAYVLTPYFYPSFAKTGLSRAAL
jgi:hypothetical protein